MVILLFTASFLLSLAVSYVISKLFRVRRGLSQPLFCQTPQRGGRQVPAVRYRVRRCYQRHKNPPAPGLHRRSPLESAGTCRRGYPGRFGPFPSTTPWSISFTELCGCWSCSPSWPWRRCFTSAARSGLRCSQSPSRRAPQKRPGPSQPAVRI